MITENLNPDVALFASPYDFRTSLSETVNETDTRAAIESGNWGFVHSFTTGSAVDGPGVRIVGWLTGCQYRCVFCHNPDTWKLSNGMPVSLARAMEVVKQYRYGLRTMKGGLTISGGEPFLQHRFVIRLFKAAREAGVHTALDTNGYLGSRVSDDDLKSVDLVMLGLKAISPDLHRRITGVENEPVIEFARRLAALRKPMWIRFVLVPGWSDDMEEIGRIADFAASLGNVERIDLLPFHQLGRFKWEKLGMEYKLHETKPPTRESVEEVAARFRASGLKVV
jgi:pyruvate formate lyase activating enzyme